MIREAEKYIWNITLQYPMSTYPLFFEAWERGVKINSVDAKHNVPPQKIMDEIRRDDWRQAIHRARADGLSVDRLAERIDLNLWMSEKEVAMVSFPKVDGGFDFSGFNSKDERARLWCSDLFQYYWKKSEPGFWDQLHLNYGDQK
jgi:predicted transcriptional regulator